MNIEQILVGVKDLPPAPQVAIKLMDLLRGDQQNNDEIVHTVEFDPALTARILRVCNSALVGGGREPIGSLEQAILRLGYQEIFRLVLALSVGGSLAKPLNKSRWRKQKSLPVANQSYRILKPLETEALCSPE